MLIYKIQNCKNGKSYVGLTTRSLQQRWIEHVQAANRINSNSYKSRMPIVRAIRKYGSNNFSIKILTKTDSLNELYDAEKFWIKKLNTFKAGYNATLGGEGTLGRIVTDATRQKLRRKRTPLQRANISQAAKGRRITPAVLQARAQHSKRMSGSGNPFSGKAWGRTGPLSLVTRQRLSKAHNGKILTKAHRKSICAGVQKYYSVNSGPNRDICYPIACFDSQNNLCLVFKNYHDAALHFNIGVKKIRKLSRQGAFNGLMLKKLGRHKIDEFELLRNKVLMKIEAGDI